jgi:uncharacterized protein (UPF0248 family)
MVYPREVLNRLKWTEGESLDEAMIIYTHRGAPDDIARIEGREIIELGRGFFHTAEASIPFHRILRIEYRGEIVFEKPTRERPSQDV